MKNKGLVSEMYQMIGNGNAMEAFEKYYDEDVVMIEATGSVRKGKDKNREFEKQFFSMIKELHGGGPVAITSDEENGITMVETWIDVTFKDGNRVKMEQVARQKWVGNKIVEERFYYNPPKM